MRRFFLIPVVVTLALLSGCVAPGMGGVSMTPTIAGGQKVRIDFDNHGSIVDGEDEDVRIVSGLLVPHLKEKNFTYLFSFQAKHGHVQAPRSVQVDDVTDDVALSLVDDQHPALNKTGIWTTSIGPVDPDKVPWLLEIENSVRIFRFTIVTADGRTLVLYQAASYPAAIKKYFREQLGIDKKEQH
jgi:hypothetical protein